jgi:nucleoside-diphosphate-sugar epimerase
MNLVEACRKHNPDARMVYTSTRQVYGRPQTLPVTEDHPTVPIDVNGINKLAAEYYHLLYHSTYGIRSSVLRLTNTFGPRQQIRGNRQGFASIFLRLALRGEMISLYGGGRQVRDFNYVDDCVDALLLAGASDATNGKVFNLGSDEVVSLRQLAELLVPLREGGRFELVPFPPERKAIDIGDYYSNYALFRAATGWAPQVGLEEGLRRTVEYYVRESPHYWEAAP